MRRGGYKPVPSKEAEEVLPTVSATAGSSKDVPKKEPKFKLSDYRVEDSDFDSLGLGKVPHGAIALAVGLMVIGMSSFVLAWLHVTQEILGKEQAEYGFTILGLLTFIPGFYHTRIAYYTWRGYKGYSWDMIPSS